MSNLTKLTCPHCQATMNASKSLRAGKKIACIKCFNEFEVPVATLQATAPAMGILESAAKAKPSSEPVHTATPITLPATRDKSTPSIIVTDAERKKRAVLLSTVAGIILIAVGVFAISYFQKSESEPTKIAEAPPKAAKQTPEPPILKKSTEVEQSPFPSDKNAPLQQFPQDNKPFAKVEVLPPPDLANAGTPTESPVHVHPPKPVPKMEKPKTSVVVRSTLSEEDQQLVNTAIDSGVRYLKKNQKPTGSWKLGNGGRFANYTVGYAALPGLTMLECQVPPDDPHVQQAAKFVRLNCGDRTKTYELALAILFLDRLGDIRDRPLIQSMAMRLVAGQHENGGWGYDCPLLPPSNMIQLYTALLKHRDAPPPFADPLENSKRLRRILAEKRDVSPKTLDKKSDQPGLAIPKEKLLPFKGAVAKNDRTSLPSGIEKSNNLNMEESDTMKLLMLPYPNIQRQFVIPESYSEKLAAYYFDPGQTTKNDTPTANEKSDSPRKAPKQKHPFENRQLRQLMDQILRMPAGPAKRKLMEKVQQALVKEQPFSMGRDDNSNSQFALLGLWAARRHGVPTEKALGDAAIRYRRSQNQDDGWAYRIGMQTSEAMTGVGLLGLAMGHGVSKQVHMKNEPPTKDRAIQLGLQTFGKFIDNSTSERTRFRRGLYFMWTVERVAVLYNLQTIEGKDWYKWGVRILLPKQAGDGSWHMQGYHGSTPTIDTCFALLFLNRSNLVQDLSDDLRFYLAITDPKSESRKTQE